MSILIQFGAMKKVLIIPPTNEVLGVYWSQLVVGLEKCLKTIYVLELRVNLFLTSACRGYLALVTSSIFVLWTVQVQSLAQRKTSVCPQATPLWLVIEGHTDLTCPDVHSWS